LQQVQPILTKLKALIDQRGSIGTARRKLQDDRWVVFVPGKYTVSVAVFSLEPAVAQIELIEDMQRDFERANAQALQQNRFNPAEMVFPHRALFEQ
jgi:hypothetical protein